MTLLLQWRESYKQKEKSTMSNQKPIQVFYSPLTRSFYASQPYKDQEDGSVIVTGKKYDVTQDIASQVVRYDLEFTEKKEGRCRHLHIQ